MTFMDMLYEGLNAKLVHAAANGNINKVKGLLEKGADANAKTRDGRTALLMAIRIGRLDIVKLLVENGADVNKPGTLKFLVDRGSTFDLRSNEITALFWAVERVQPEIVRFLVDHGADLNAKDNNGNTVLIKAVYSNNLDIIKCLVEHGADSTVKDDNGETAAMHAKRRGYNDVAAYLDSIMQMGNEITNSMRNDKGNDNKLKPEVSNVLRRK